MRQIALTIALTCGLGLLSLKIVAEETKPQAVKTETLKGVVVEKRADVKSFEAWNAPSDPYYVLALDLKPGEKHKKRHVTLRPSKKIPTAELKKYRGLKLSIQGHFVKGKIYKPSGVESFPVELADPIGSDPKAERKTRPARRGSGFVVLKIAKAE